MIVVEALVEDAIRSWPLFEVQLEKANGPLPNAAIDALTPASYQPSPVGLDPELEYEPLRVVVSMHASAVEAGEAASGLEVDVTPLQVFDEYASVVGHDADQDIDVEPEGKL